MTTVAYIGNFEPPFSTENDCRVALEALGCEVIRLQENRATFQQVRDAGLASDLLLWTTTWDEAQPMQESLVTARMLAESGIPSAAYHLDTFWRLRRNGRNWRDNPSFHLRRLFTADGSPVAQRSWEALRGEHTWLPAGVRHTATEPGHARKEFICDVAFVGSDGRGYHPEWPYRQELVTELERICARRGWTFRNPGGRQEKVPRDERMNDFYASAKVTVGDSLCLDRADSLYWSDRVYEATGRGGFLIMPDIDALTAADQFDGWLPTYEWGDWENLEHTIDHFLTYPTERAHVRQRCWEITRSQHTYLHRMRDLLTQCGVL